MVTKIKGNRHGLYKIEHGTLRLCTWLKVPLSIPQKLSQPFFLSFAADILVRFLEYSQQHGVIVDSRMVILFEYE